METFLRVTGLCAGKSPLTDEFPSQKPMTRSFAVFFDLRLKKRFSEQSKRRWFETLWRSLRRRCNVDIGMQLVLGHQIQRIYSAYETQKSLA